MRPFREVRVQPCFGHNKAIVSWDVEPHLRGGAFTVYRSKDETNWTQAHVGVGQNQYIDPEFVVRDRLSNYFYRVEVSHNNQIFSSDIVATFGPVDRMTYGTANVLLQDWGKKIQQGTAIKIFRQLIYGRICPVCVDQDTGQQMGTTLCRTCFATGYEGGFAPPIAAYMLKAEVPARATMDMEDGKGTRDAQIFTCRMLSYPSLRRGDLIADVRRDDRYLVGGSRSFEVMGKITILYDVELELLRRNDVRYLVDTDPAAVIWPTMTTI